MQKTSNLKIEKIVSGGQTGADRAALDFAVEHGISHGGWCPRGRKAEDGPIDPHYQLRQTPSSAYIYRTELNARDSDGTVVFTIAAKLSGSSLKTVVLAHKLDKPVCHIWRNGGPPSPEQVLLRFVRDNNIKVLNVAGPRASKEPEIAAFVQEVLEAAFAVVEGLSRCEPSRARPAHVGQPTLETPRLILRPFTPSDAPTVAKLAGTREIADATIPIPHPDSEPHARDWIARNIEGCSPRKEVVFAVVTKTDMQLVGAVGLRDIDHEHGQAELGFWIGVDWQGRLYATEAAHVLLQFGFQTLGLNRIYAHHLLSNPASGHVLKRIGMTHEGVLRERVRKRGVFEDVAVLSILRKEWQGQAD